MANTSPSNSNSISFLSPLKFSFSIKKLPNVNFFAQSLILPSITLPPTFVPTPFVKLPKPGDHLEYGEIQVTFRVDEDMRNYREIFVWLNALGFPENFEQYKALADKDSILNVGEDDALVSDATIMIYDSNSNKNIEIKIIDMFPTSLLDLLFDMKPEGNIEYVESTATFSFLRIEAKKVEVPETI